MLSVTITELLLKAIPLDLQLAYELLLITNGLLQRTDRLTQFMHQLCQLAAARLVLMTCPCRSPVFHRRLISDFPKSAWTKFHRKFGRLPLR